MKLFRTDKKPVGAYRCPLCKSVYRHAGMAERCTKTPVCRLYNAPPAEVREMWRFAGGSASLGWFFAHPLFDLETAPEVHEAAGAVQRASENLFAVLHRLFPCAEPVRHGLHNALMDEVAAVWAPGHAWHMGYVSDVVQSVLCDAVTDAGIRKVPDAVLDALRTLEGRVEDLYAAFIPEGEADYEEDAVAAIVRLSDATIGAKPAGRRPSLYLVNGRHLVVGRGRADVRRVMMACGLSKPDIRGISSGEKFEDGRTAEELIKTAVRVPALIGRMEE